MGPHFVKPKATPNVSLQVVGQLAMPAGNRAVLFSADNVASDLETHWGWSSCDLTKNLGFADNP